MTPPVPYPGTTAERSQWVLSLRPDLATARAALALDRPGDWLVETEPDGTGRLAEVLTIFLTNRECPWRCVMCDLWRHTTLEAIPAGAIPSQMDCALRSWNPAAGDVQPRHLKLYNAGSFFDRGAIPTEDHAAIALRCAGFERVIVECHPALVGDEVLRFRDLLPPGTGLEVAMGLETADSETLLRLNKGVTVESFRRASEFLARNGIGVRVFVLVQPPFQPVERAVEWAVRSAALAFDAGASVVALIPTRTGNGAMEALARLGHFTPPSIETLEAAFAGALALRRGRVFADLWNLELFCTGVTDTVARKERLHRANLSQWGPAAQSR